MPKWNGGNHLSWRDEESGVLKHQLEKLGIGYIGAVREEKKKKEPPKRTVSLDHFEEGQNHRERRRVHFKGRKPESEAGACNLKIE